MSRPARMCISVDLPDPDGPHHGGELPARDLDGDPAESVDRCLALAVAPCHVARDNDRPVVSAHLSPRLGSFVSTHGGCPSRERGGVRKTLLRGVVRGWLWIGRSSPGDGPSEDVASPCGAAPRPARRRGSRRSRRTRACRATSGGEIWMTGIAAVVGAADQPGVEERVREVAAQQRLALLVREGLARVLVLDELDRRRRSPSRARRRRSGGRGAARASRGTRPRSRARARRSARAS